MITTLLISLAVVVGAYIVGSLSSAIIICKLTGAPDPRTTGSNNPGATNVLRVGGKARAAAVLAGDLLKGVVVVALAKAYGPDWLVACSYVAVFIGHLLPIFFRFQGGKGVATAFGGLLALHWLLALSILAIWLTVVFVTRYSSLGALVAAASAPLLAWLVLGSTYGATLFLIASLLLYRHQKNISRLAQGKEPKIGEKAPNTTAEAIKKEDFLR